MGDKFNLGAFFNACFDGIGSLVADMAWYHLKKKNYSAHVYTITVLVKEGPFSIIVETEVRSTFSFLKGQLIF